MTSYKGKNFEKKELIFFIWFVCSTIVLIFLRAHGEYDTATILFFSAMAGLSMAKSKMPLSLVCLVLVSIIVRGGYAYYLYSRNVVVFPDTLGYFGVLDIMSTAPSVEFKSVTRYAGTLHVGYHYLSFFCLTLFKTKLALYLLNVFLFLQSLLLFWRYVKDIFGKEAATVFTAFLSFSALTFIFTSDVLKDSLILFLVTLALYVYERFRGGNRIVYIIPLLLILGFLTMSRIYSGIGLFVGISVDFLLARNIKINAKKAVLLTLFAVALLWFTPFNVYVDMGISFVNNINITPGLLISLLKSTLSFFFSPFFWNMISNISIYTLLLIDSMFLLVFSPLLVAYFFRFLQTRELRRMTYIYVIPTLFHIFALGVQYDTGAVRQKIAVYPFFALFYILGLKGIQPRSERR